MDKLTIRDFDAAGKRVFVRVDFNVPLADGKVTDDSRIRAALPTINDAPRRRAPGSILASHLGRPDGKVQDGLRLRPVGAAALSQLLRRNVPVTGDALGVGTEDAVKRMRNGEAILLENLRFHAEEEKNDPAFAADARVVRRRLRQRRVRDGPPRPRLDGRHRAAPAGLRRAADGARDRDALSSLLENPEHPFAAILGGAKVCDKIKRHRPPPDEGRPPRPRRRDGEHVPARPGQVASARASPSTIGSTTPGGSSPRPRRPACRSSCRPTS